ncbi:bifunctional phosphopantothenoylcysteine decarboxylase/phosphopantothenate--cysteine ligase CoaBC [bacterium]|nr:bifunctional phosphopantothenoylcysteine decarboxylase/phosphopantothenate--cysteine ligase CoaBC [bacterium]
MTTHSARNKIVLGVTGSIAAYKAAELARRYVTRGFEVKAIFSEQAEKFIAPLTFQTITGHPVLSSWEQEEACGIGHIEYADWADLFVIAPATANVIAKYAAGIADSPLLASLLASRTRVLMAPAMNVNMLSNPATQTNLQILKERGVLFVEPGEGRLACGWRGRGRMSEPWNIFHHTLKAFGDGSYVGKRVLVVTGPTREPLDPVRFISNRSSGKMGVAIAREAFRRGAQVEVICGPVKAKLPTGIETSFVSSAEDMKRAVVQRAFPEAGEAPDVIIMAAAVSDVRPKRTSEMKLKKGELPSSLGLEPNTDILAELGRMREKNGSQVKLVGFAVETGEVEDLVASVQQKLSDKKVDMIVGNLAEESLELQTNRVWIVDKHGRETEVATSYKNRVAEKILHHVRKL